jgi:hypothetical protein
MSHSKLMVTRWGRWTATFVGFPLAGFVARLVAGGVDSPTAAIVSGLVGGAVLGGVQIGIGGVERVDRFRWFVATVAGLAVGLGIGSTVVDQRTDTASLVVMGAVCGAAVGLAQALAVPMRLVDRVMWAVATPTLWAAGWLITSHVIVDAHRQHAMFGSSGAIAVSAIAGVLVAVRRRPADQPIAVPSVSRLAAEVAR